MFLWLLVSVFEESAEMLDFEVRMLTSDRGGAGTRSIRYSELVSATSYKAKSEEANRNART